MRLKFQKTIRSQEKSKTTVKDEAFGEGSERKNSCSGGRERVYVESREEGGKAGCYLDPMK